MDKKLKYKQLNLLTNEETDNEREVSLVATENSSNKVPLLFRNTIPEIPSTTYGTFAIYKYPAKFIPQVIAYVLKKYAKPGMKIFDPFAGYGTMGVVSRVYGYDYELWDLNPIIIEELLKRDWKHQFYSMLKKEIGLLLKKVWEYHRLNPKAEVTYGN